MELSAHRGYTVSSTNEVMLTSWH